MRALYSAGDFLPDLGDGTPRRRYAMDGDTYLTSSTLGERADVLWAKACAAGRTNWLPGIVLRLRLAEWDNTDRSGPAAELAAVTILAAAGITWTDICWMKS